MKAVLTPTCLKELFQLWESYPDATFMAGGTDLLVKWRSQSHNQAVKDKRILMSLAQVAELHGVYHEGSTLAIGAATRFAHISSDPLIAKHVPLLAQAVRTIGGPAIRNMATIGGNIATASPAGDSLPPLYVLDAEVEVVTQNGKRCFPIGEFITGAGQNTLRTGEIISRILVPVGETFPCQWFEKIGRRKAMAIAVTSCSGLVRLSGKGTIEAARFAWGSVAPTVVRLPLLEKKLIGASLDDDTISWAKHLVCDGVSPISDVRATADYRRRVAGNLLVRLLENLRG